MKGVTFLALFFLMEVSVKVFAILHGVKVNSTTEFPYMCGIFINTSDGKNNIPCGCAIISPNYALTAAHCFDDPRAHGTPFTFFAGSVNFKEGVTREIFKETDVIIHPDFDMNGTSPLTNSNLAIIKLNPPLNFTDNIKNIKIGGPILCSYGNSPDHIITGWGSNNTDSDVPRWESKNRSYSEFLLWGEADREDCEQLKLPRGSDERNFCSSNPSGACIGDTGGPWVLRYRYTVRWPFPETKGFLLCGIVGVGHCSLKYTVYMKVAYYMEWICENTNIEEDKRQCKKFKRVKLEPL